MQKEPRKWRKESWLIRAENQSETPCMSATRLDCQEQAGVAVYHLCGLTVKLSVVAPAPAG